MGEILACRVCMSTSVKLYDMYKNNLTTAYEILTGLEVQKSNKLPTRMCGVCSTMLLKCIRFRESCQRTHDLLIFSYQQKHEVSTDYIKSLNFNYHPLSSLSVHVSVEPLSLATSSVVELAPVDGLKVETDPKATDFVTAETERTLKTEESSHDELTEENALDDVDFHNDDDDGGLAELDEGNTEPEDGFLVRFLTREEQLEEVRARKQTSNYQTSLYKCDKCFKGYMTDVTFRNHQLKHDLSTGPYECEICLVRFPSKRSFKHHNTRSHEREYKCRWCSFVAKARSQARAHSKWHNGHVFVCKTCGATFRKATTHLSHVRKQHPSEHVCPLCGESFIGKHGLLMHRKKAHRQSLENDITTGAVYACDACNVAFRTKDALQTHILTAKGDCTGYKPCLYCGENIGKDCDMKEHLAKHVGRKECTQCKRTFCNERNYAIHMQRARRRNNKRDPTAPCEESSDYSVVCEICGRKCKSKSLLTYHQRSHTGETPFECTFCPKKFTLSVYLKIHLRKHTGETPYTCGDCPKKFTNKAALNRHYRVHTGEKPYSCSHCGKSFSQSNSVKVHIQTVHLKQPTPYKNKIKGKPRDIDMPVVV